MPLSEYEQRVLAQMERQLSSDDPKLAQTFSAAPRARRTSRVLLGGVAAVVGLGTIVVALVQNASWLGVLGFLVMFAGVLYSLSRGTASASEAERSTAQAAAHGAGQRSSFMDKLDDRWDKRRQQRG